MTDEGEASSEFSEDQRKHLEFVQATISRLAGNSASTKTWTVTIGLAGFGLAKVKTDPSIAIAAVLLVAVLGLLDSRYLRQERLFRKLFDAVRKDDGGTSVYSMNASAFASDKSCRLRACLVSWSVAGFYGLLVVLGIVAVIADLVS